jgi:hypothetical protein
MDTGNVTNYGGQFEAAGSYGRGVYGAATSTSSTNYGGYFEADGAYGRGVYGRASNGGDYTNYGGYFSASGRYGRGVYAYAAGNNAEAVYGYAGGTNAYAGYFYAPYDYSVGIYAYGGASGWAADFRGNVRVRDRSSGTTVIELGTGLDYAEGFDVSDKKEIKPGSVLIIDPDNPGKLKMSDTPYDTKVAGIVAGAKGLGSGVRLGASQFDHNVALAGRVYCNVDATLTGVEPGDLLTTSATTGCAMKVTDYGRAQGAILGKAMQKLDKGEKGQILVLVTLQ